jgi:uncharacterized protein (TIGR02271 family)
MTHERLSQSDWELDRPEDDLRGRSVMDDSDHAVGRVTDMLVDSATSTIDGVVLDDGRELGMDQLDQTGAGLRIREGWSTDTEPSGQDLAETDAASHDTVRVRRHEEQLQATTERARAGEVQIDKQVVEERQQLNVPVTREEVEIRRVAVDRAATGDEEAFAEGDTIRVPVVEERVVTRKEPRVVEELEISKRSITETERVDDTVRKERIDVRQEGDVTVSGGSREAMSTTDTSTRESTYRDSDTGGRDDRGEVGGEAVGAGGGALAGAAVGGVVGGPPGAVVGGIVGAAGGALAGEAVEGGDEEAGSAAGGGVGSVAGAAIGGAVAGPPGAAVGAAVGAGAGAAVGDKGEEEVKEDR